MSVINKVLRDLDQRLAANRPNPLHPLHQSGEVGSSIRSIAAKDKKNPPLWMMLVVGGITLVIVGAAVWWSIQPAPIAIPVAPPAMPVPPPVAVAIPATPVPVPAPSVPVVVASAPVPVVASAPVVVASSAVSAAVAAVSSPKMAAIKALPKPVSAKAASAAMAASAPTAVAPSPAVSAESPASMRELVRLQLAKGDYLAVWNTLANLEESSKNSDLWAIRANAAQRLGRHQDSVHAYLMALEANPNETRWLLGAAVSLAALGKTTQASEMAEKARSLAPINKDVLNYLRQSGVSLND